MPMGVGSTFADYTIVRRLGAGGMGEVYLARHPRLPRSDALKLLSGNISSDPSFRERFLREADLASTLWHPHIVGVHDRGEHDGQLWISMDFVDGQDAGSLSADRYPGGMPPDLVVAIVTAVASALDYAHEQGLLHRDVKPANILLANVEQSTSRRILLTDFGIARTVDDHVGLTATNMTVGTIDYTSPEQLMGDALDGRADQYSLAATAFHLLAGAPPFRHTNAAVVIGRHLNTPPPALSDGRPELAALDAPLTAALAKDPGERFASCSDFARALADAADAAGSAAGAGAPPTALAHVPPPTTPIAAAPVTVAAPMPPVMRPTPTPPPGPQPTPGPLAPGWYPDPNGGPAARYWDGRSWGAAPMPGGRRGGLSVPLLLALGGAVVLIVIGALFLLGRSDESAPTAAPGAGTSSLVRMTTTAPSQPDSTAPTTSLRPQPTQPPPPRPTSWSAVVVGSCDEGGSCGVRQRTAPYNDAPSLYPTVLRDGVSVTVTCQTTGDLRSNAGYGSSRVWYRLDSGAYVNAVYLALRGSGVSSC